jgi:beta-lactam-binding protein with PASTA domain
MTRSWIRSALLLVCAIFVSLLVCCAPASALVETVLPSKADAGISDGSVPNYVQSQAPSQEVADYVCNQVCQRLRAARRAPMPNEVGAAAVRREEFALMEAVGSAPYLRALGTVGLGAEAFSLGWKIGTGIRAKFMHVEMPAIDAVSGLYQHYENPRLEPCTYFAEPFYFLGGLAGFGYSSCRGAGWAIYHGEDGGHPMFALEYDGFTNDTYRGRVAGFCPENPMWWPPIPLFGPEGGAAYYDVSGGPGGSSCGQGTPGGLGWQMSLTYTLDVGTLEGYAGQQYTQETTWWPGMPTTIAELQDRIRHELQTYYPFYHHLIEWLDNKLGGTSEDPTGQTNLVTVPNCAGLSLGTCQTRLDDAGLTNVDIERVSTEDADIHKAPDEVLSISPPGGGDVDRSSQIRLVVNPTEALFPHVVPDCRGATFDQCAREIVDAGFDSSSRENLSFDDAVPYPTGMPDEVFGTRPAAASRATRSTEIHVTANPPDADLPRLVPPVELNEQYESYAARVATLGLAPNRFVLDQTDWSYEPGAAIESTPSEGTRAKRGAQVDVSTNPDTDVRQHFDTRCEPSTPLNRDPAAAEGLDTTFEGQYAPYRTNVFKRNILVLTNPKKPGKAAKPGKDDAILSDTWLRVGDVWPSTRYPGRSNGWGYRHVAWNHGWGTRDAGDTRDALLTPAIEAQADGTLVYVGPVYKLNGIKCVRKVVVATQRRGARPRRPADPVVKGIITSYGLPEGEVFAP